MVHLRTPLTMDKLSLNNRLVLPPMATAKAEMDGSITNSLVSYYDEKSKGGYLSFVIIEHSYITLQGKASEKQLSAADDSVIVGLKKLSDTLHKNGSKVAMQLNHAGSAADKNTGMEIVGPSAILNTSKNVIPKELSKEQIQKIIEDFKLAAIRTQKAGFDAVEIHSAHGYLLNQFYSPLTNERSDEYGGTIYGRIRIHLEVIKAIRDAVGENFPILLRLGAGDYVDGGSTIADAIIAAQEFEKAGVDILDISGGICGYRHPQSIQAGYFSDMSLPIKKVTNFPIILTGGITTPEEAEELLVLGAADLIGVGRAILQDSDWAEKCCKVL